MWNKNTKNFCNAFGISIPIVQAPMAGGPTRPSLVAAVSEGGGLGSIGAGNMKAGDLQPALKETKRADECSVCGQRVCPSRASAPKRNVSNV